MNARRQSEAIGALIGIGVAATVLAFFSVWLLSVEGAGAKVLVAVWLWALPALGLGAATGWLLVRVGESLFRRQEVR